jgi:hypothetical protein
VREGGENSEQIVHANNDDAPFQFKLFKIYELIGDTPFYDILNFFKVLKPELVARRGKKYFSTYEFITIDFLHRRVTSVTKFSPFVAFTAGYSDQTKPHKFNSGGIPALFGRNPGALAKTWGQARIISCPPSASRER